MRPRAGMSSETRTVPGDWRNAERLLRSMGLVPAGNPRSLRLGRGDGRTFIVAVKCRDTDEPRGERFVWFGSPPVVQTSWPARVPEKKWHVQKVDDMPPKLRAYVKGAELHPAR